MEEILNVYMTVYMNGTFVSGCLLQVGELTETFPRQVMIYVNSNAGHTGIYVLGFIFAQFFFSVCQFTENVT